MRPNPFRAMRPNPFLSNYAYMWREAFRIAQLYIFVQEDRGPGAVTPLRVVWRGISAEQLTVCKTR